MKRAGVLAVAWVAVGAQACGAARGVPGPGTAVHVAGAPQGEPGGGLDAGSSDAAASTGASPARDPASAGVALSADAGVRSAEIAWMVAHIGDDPDRLHSADSANVRALANYGADGVRAVAHVLRRGDANRARFARRVLERVLLRACRVRGREHAQRLALWLELGRVPDDAVSDAGVLVWTHPDEQMWSGAALARMETWAGAGLPCEEVERDAGAEPGTGGGADEDASVRVVEHWDGGEFPVFAGDGGRR